MMTWKLLCWCLDHGISLKAVHIPGRLNLLADSLSRRMSILPTERQLNQCVADRLFNHWGKPNIDLFATNKNAKMTTCVSPVPDPKRYHNRCVSYQLGGNVCIRIPASNPDSKSSPENQAAGMPSASDRPKLAKPIMVYGSAGPSGLQSCSSASDGQHNLPGQGLAQQPVNVPIDCVDVVKESAVTERFSEQAAMFMAKARGGQPPEHIIIKSTDLLNGAQKDVLTQWKHLFR
jgi:hypothetical protein